MSMYRDFNTCYFRERLSARKHFGPLFFPIMTKSADLRLIKSTLY